MANLDHVYKDESLHQPASLAMSYECDDEC